MPPVHQDVDEWERQADGTTQAIRPAEDDDVSAPVVSTSTHADVPSARFDLAGRGTVEGLPQRP